MPCCMGDIAVSVPQTSHAMDILHYTSLILPYNGGSPASELSNLCITHTLDVIASRDGSESPLTGRRRCRALGSERGDCLRPVALFDDSLARWPELFATFAAMDTFFRKKNRPRQSSVTSPDAHERTLRPLSYASIATSRSGESSRQSRVSPSLSPLESQHPHLSSISSHLHRLAPADEFYFPRPDDEQIEAMFQNIMRSKGLEGLPTLTLDQKWSMVWSDEQLRWKEERQREEQLRKHHTSPGQPPTFAEGSPEWYIKKFLDKTITQKQASGLLVSLRSKDIE